MIESIWMRFIIDMAVYFGIYVIIAMALNFQYGNAGVPNMGSAVSVAIGGYVSSGIVTRIIYWVGKNSGVNIGPDWVYDSPTNVMNMNLFLKDHVRLSISIFLLAIALSLVIGAILGYFISLPAIRLRSTYLMITLITMADASQIIGRNYIPISGGTIGIFIPNLFAWYQGDRSLITAIVSLVIGSICFFIFRLMLNSPYGRLMRAVRENDVTLGSVGKNVTAIRRNILMFASGITSVAGLLVAFYFSYSVESNYRRIAWTYWPWLMLMVGGPGNNAGTFLGCALIIAVRKLIIINKWFFDKYIFYPLPFFEQQLLGLVLIIILVFRPKGLIPEKLLYIPGVKYKELIEEETRVDWRMKAKAVSIRELFKNLRKKKGDKNELG